MATNYADCPDCGKEVAVNMDGSLRKHTCQVLEPAESAVSVEETHNDVPESSETCPLAGCERRPLVGFKHCAQHWTREALG